MGRGVVPPRCYRRPSSDDVSSCACTAYLPKAISSGGVCGLMEGMSRPEPPEQSVLGSLSVVQPDETDTPERLALASQMNHKQSRFKSSAGEFSSDDELGLEILEIGCAAVSAGCRYPRSSTHGGNIQSTASEFAGPCAGPGQLIYPPHPSPFEQGALDVNRKSDNLDSCSKPQSGSDSGQSSLEWEDVIRHAVLKSRSMGRVPGHDDNALMLSPVEACCGDKELSMDEVRSEGLRQWNMDMDVECQYETFNGLPVYYGGDLCDLKELEEYDTLDLTNTHSRPDGGEARV